MSIETIWSYTNTTINFLQSYKKVRKHSTNLSELNVRVYSLMSNFWACFELFDMSLKHFRSFFNTDILDVFSICKF